MEVYRNTTKNADRGMGKVRRILAEGRVEELDTTRSGHRRFSGIGDSCFHDMLVREEIIDCSCPARQFGKSCSYVLATEVLLAAEATA
jgi:hypothetical protein